MLSVLYPWVCGRHGRNDEARMNFRQKEGRDKIAPCELDRDTIDPFHHQNSAYTLVTSIIFRALLLCFI